MSENESTLSHFPDTDPRPERIGPYRIREVLGEGGMGTVYLAEQTEPVRRRVALKLIKLGMDTREVIARFESERQALALMNHPHVAAVYDAGATEQGRPYFVMEYVPGEPITAYCDKHQLSLPERLNLFMQVCHAIQHAHQKGIIHRDIKPSNVLVMYQDGKPVPKVIDFGVAKATNQRLTEKTVFTEQGRLIGTPAYMSPEQAEMTTLDIDTRTDVYSLGVLLYELLTGTVPFDPKSLLGAGFAAIQRIIREVEPSKPSTKLSSLDAEPRPSESGKPDPELPAPGLSTPRSGSGLGSVSDVAKRRRTDPKSLVRQVRGDLDWITMKALEKDRIRRYDSASDFAADIQRHLRHEPVVAGPPGVGYRLRKFVRRNRVGVIAASAVLVVLLAGITGTSWGLLAAVDARDAEAEQRSLVEWERDRAIEAEQESEQRRAEAEAVTKFLSDMLAAVRPAKQGIDVSVRQILDQASKTIGEKFGDQPLIEARLRDTIGTTYLWLGVYDKAESHFVVAARIYRKNLGESHPSTLGLIQNLAIALQQQGKLSDAEEPQRRTLEIRRRILGEEHPLTLSSMHNVAITLAKGGKLSEAEELNRKILTIRRRVLGEEHYGTLASIANLAIVLAEQGKVSEAEELFRTEVEIMRRVFGEEHQETLRSIHNLASGLAQQGKFAQAEDLFRRTLEIKHRVLGERHPDTIESMMSLAGTLYNEGKVGEAEELYGKTLEIGRRILSEEHPYTLRSMSGLLDVLNAQDKVDKARRLAVELIEHRRRRAESPNSSPDDLNEYASLLLTCKPENLRDPAVALPLAKKAVEMTGGKNNSMLDTLALAYQMTGDIDQAVNSQRKALSLLLPDPTLRRTELETNLGEYLVGQEKYAEAEPLLRSAYQVIKDNPYARDEQVAEAIERLVNLYDAWHAAESDTGYDAKAAQWRTKLPKQSAE